MSLLLIDALIDSSVSIFSSIQLIQLMLIEQWQSHPVIWSTGKYHFPDQQGRWVLPSIRAGICRLLPITGVESI